MSHKIMSEVFKLRDSPCYNLRHISLFARDQIHSFYNGTDSASYLRPKILEQIPKNKESLEKVKREIKKWKPTECPCRICRTYVPNLDFI